MLAEIIRNNYGDQVEMKYIDVVDDDMDPYPEVESYLQRAGMQLPLLVINGKIIRPGLGLNYMEIVEDIEGLGVKKLEQADD